MERQSIAVVPWSVAFERVFRVSAWEVLLYSLLFFWIAVAIGHSDLPHAKWALEAEGYTEVTVRDAGLVCPHWWQVDRVSFDAVNTAGEFVIGTVCSGFNQPVQIMLDRVVK